MPYSQKVMGGVMKFDSVGFIGGGRVAQILLGGLKKAGFPVESVVVSDVEQGRVESVVVSDVEQGRLERLHQQYPGIAVTADNREAARQHLVFVAVHPPTAKDVLKEVADQLRPDSVLISLAPNLTITALTDILGGFPRIVRMIPNAPSIIGQGYNPITFSPIFPETEQQALRSFFSMFGESPVVPEEKLEAFVVITAMSPTYFWFQWAELQKIGQSFGLAETEAKEGITKMVKGAVETLFESGFSPEEVMELILAKPLGNDEEDIKNIYRTRLEAVYQKLKTRDRN